MEDTYTVLQVIARSWGAVFMLAVFLGVIVFVLRPGSRKLHREIADIPFRHDDRPATGVPSRDRPATGVQTKDRPATGDSQTGEDRQIQIKEARQ